MVRTRSSSWQPAACSPTSRLDSTSNSPMTKSARSLKRPIAWAGGSLPMRMALPVIEERWANWMRHDPVVAVETQRENLRRLKALYIDCGERDQFNLLYGARRFVRRLNELGNAQRYDLNRTLTTDPGRFNLPRARLAPAMISTPGHWASRRRQRGALPAWSLRIVIGQGVFLLDREVLLTCALRISLVAQTSYCQRFLGG